MSYPVKGLPPLIAVGVVVVVHQLQLFLSHLPPSRSVSPPPPLLGRVTIQRRRGRVEARDRMKVYVIPWQMTAQTFHVI